MAFYNLNFNPADYFSLIKNSNHRQYLALRCYFVDEMSAKSVAREYGYAVSTVYSMVRDFKKALAENPDAEPFFKESKLGRNEIDPEGTLLDRIVELRKKYFSVPEIKAILDSQKIEASEKYISNVLKREGFDRLPQRSSDFEPNLPVTLDFPQAGKLDFSPESFTSQAAGMLFFLPLLKRYGIDRAIEQSGYPESETIDKLSAVLCFLALKLSQTNRYAADNVWCTDRGVGLFAGLNVLPAASWYNAYANNVTSDMNREFIQSLYRICQENNLLADTVSIDSATVPYWQEMAISGNIDAGVANRQLSSMLIMLAQDPESGIICYKKSPVEKDNQYEGVVEFLEFYRAESGTEAYYLLLNSRAVSYVNLSRLNQAQIRFITARRRGSKLIDRIYRIPDDSWEEISVLKTQSKGQGKASTSGLVKAFEETIQLKGYEGSLRQVFVTGLGEMDPVILISNDFDLPLKELVRKYSSKWLDTSDIARQLAPFHLNQSSLGLDIASDFDLTVSILAHTLYRLLALNLDHYSSLDNLAIFKRIVQNTAQIEITGTAIDIRLKKRQKLAPLLERIDELGNDQYRWLGMLPLKFSFSSTT